MKNGPAIFALTLKGAQKAALLHSKIGGDLYLPEKFRGEILGVEAEFFAKTASELVEDLFLNYRKIIGFCALGALVRLIAPFLKEDHSSASPTSFPSQRNDRSLRRSQRQGSDHKKPDVEPQKKQGRSL